MTYGHDEAMRDLDDALMGSDDQWQGQVDARDRVRAYIESLEKQRDWLAAHWWSAVWDRWLVNPDRLTQHALKAAEEATR